MTKTVEDLQVGDVVVINSRGYGSPKYKFDTITRITKTRITCEKDSYMKSSLRRVGDGEAWYPKQLAVDHSERGLRNLLSVEKAQEYNKEWDKKHLARMLARKLQQVSIEKWQQLSTERLQEILNEVTGE